MCYQADVERSVAGFVEQSNVEQSTAARSAEERDVELADVEQSVAGFVDHSIVEQSTAAGSAEERDVELSGELDSTDQAAVQEQLCEEVTIQEGVSFLLRKSMNTKQKISAVCLELSDVEYDSGSEYLPSDEERAARNCIICKDDVFVACPTCLNFLCYDHRQTDCAEHTAPSALQIPLKRKISCLNLDENPKPRKRLRNESKWHRIQSRKSREKGLSYVSYTGRVIPAKEMCSDDVLCREKCKRQCSRKLTMQQRQEIFSAFYNLDNESKNCYLFKSITPVKPKFQRTDATLHRTMSFHYHVVVNGQTVHICKRAFAKLHQISDSKIFHLTQQLKDGASAPRPSQRGKHTHRPNRLSPEDCHYVTEHISMFPAESSHYSRSKNSARSYLSSTLSIGKMYSLYINWCKEKEIVPVSKHAYNDIFVTKFNLGFGSPRSDTCSTCDVGTDKEHMERAEKAFEMQRNDRQLANTDSSVVYLTFDLQKSLPLPKLSTGLAFYLRQLWLYNFGIHWIDAGKNRAHFNIWTENQAGRGSEEIGSSLLAFIEDTRIGSSPTPCQLITWCDNCSGQNKNFIILCVWQYLIATKNFSAIEQKFPETGHTFLDSDRDFAHIEKKVRKEQNIYTVDQYSQIFIESQTKNKPRVTRMQDRFFQLKMLPATLGLYNNHVNTDGQPVRFRDTVRWIRVSEFGTYEYRESFDTSVPWKKVVIHRAASQLPVVGVDLLARTENSRPISTKKAADITKQIPYIPPVYRLFYQLLTTASNEDGGNTDDSMADFTSVQETDSNNACSSLASRDNVPKKTNKVTSIGTRTVRRNHSRKKTTNQGEVAEVMTCTTRRSRRQNNNQGEAAEAMTCTTRRSRRQNRQTE